MKIQVFRVSALEPYQDCEELNKFMVGRNVLEIVPEFCSDGINSYWSILVKYLDSLKKHSKSKQKKEERIDYRERLDTKSFERFCMLRKARKKVAEKMAIPAYAILTDAQMAELSKYEEINQTGYSGVHGIGKGKADRFGDELIQSFYQELADKEETPRNETDRKSVSKDTDA